MKNVPRYLRRLLTAGTILWALALTTAPVQGQEASASVFEPAALDGAKTWCWERDPLCSPLAHASVTVGFSAVADLVGIDGSDARWLPLGFYAAKEIHDMSRFGFDGTVPAYDYALDFGGAVVGWWISGLLFGGDS